MEQTEFTKDLISRRENQIQIFDKLVVTLNSGALILSIGFIENLIVLQGSSWQVLLFSSWIAFTISLISALFAHKFSIKTLGSIIDNKGEKIINRQVIITKRMNNCAFYTLILGIVLLLIYLFKNLYHG